MQQEAWLPIPGHEGYEASNLGRIRSIRILSPGRTGQGHLRVCLNEGKQRSVHQLVLEAFVGPSGGLLALHRDGDPGNNRIENLYWGTYSDNLNDSVRHGTHQATVKTHCKLGHPLTYRTNGRRYCKICNSESARRSKLRAQVKHD